MAATHVALLRGINVGKAKRIAMADLRRAIESLGATGVRTLLNSGNAVFAWPVPRASPAAIAQAIEDAVEKRLGVRALVVVLTRAVLARIVADLPPDLAAMEPSRVLVGVPPAPSDLKALARLRDQDWSPESLEVGPRAACMGVPRGIADSEVVRAVEDATERRITCRNIATLRKLVALCESDAP